MSESHPFELAIPAWSQAAVDTMACLVCVLDRDARVLAFNRGCEDVSGLSAAEVLGRRFWDVLIPPEDVGAQREAFAGLLEGDLPASSETPHASEAVWRTRAGGRRNVSLRSAVIGEGDDAVVVSTGVDVTEAREVERALAELDEQHTLLVEHSAEMISRFSLDGVRDYVSPACRALLGFEPDELMGSSPFWHVHDDDVPAARAAVAEILRTGGPVTLEQRLRRRDGSDVWVETTGHAVRAAGDETPYLQTETRDISHRHRIADALRAAESENGVLFDGSPVAMARMSIDGMLQRVNAALCSFLGYPPDELIGRPWQDFTHPDDVAESVQGLERLLAGEPGVAIEKRYRRKDGSYRVGAAGLERGARYGRCGRVPGARARHR